MITDPVLILGSPRSGTSLLQKITRECPGFYSLPSESNEIWDEYCHPMFREWTSEYIEPEAATPEVVAAIRVRFDSLVWSAWMWRLIRRDNLIWSFERTVHQRKRIRAFYHALSRLREPFRFKGRPRRLVEKTASNCFRLEYVERVFPDARLIYVCRDGRNAVSSIIDGWRHPTRFFSYEVPYVLRIAGYDYQQWNFTLPPGWREYVDRPLEEVCAFQWTQSNEYVLKAEEQGLFGGRILRVKLEDLTASSESELQRIADFMGKPYQGYFSKVASQLPVVNSAEENPTSDRWQRRNTLMVENVIPLIEPTMKKLGYDI